ncbi:tail tape measure protein [Paenibacillus sp. 8b26]|uniref:tail tape measure protein n=1 Tax=Paenibacillus sp. 8b26 TaxID=3424133 RepID=UPI003D64EE06
MITGAVRNMRRMLQGAHSDLINFRRASGDMFDDFVSGSRRARESADDLGRRIGDTSDEVRRMNQIQLDDIFRRARAGADDLRRSADRADADIRGIRDAHVKLRASDAISPVVDNISSKVSALAALAGGIVLGGGLSDSMFGGVQDYSREAARSAAFMPENIRQQSLSTVDNLYKQGIIPDRVEGTRQLADGAPLVQNKSRMMDFASASNKIQFIRPDAGAEEVQRALSQASNSFKETYSQVSDSMMYAYKEVGDKQQDLFDTFWEYSPYFSSSGTDSEQMANFLTETVQNGAFNFDKPADFFKETFGVKALNTGDMAKYFEHRGTGKDEAQRQATVFTSDINSGDKQRAQGAITALVADLASQTRSQLKESLVTLGSGAGEDNADSILQTFGTAFEEAPDMKGTTDNLVRKQQAANPMTELIQTRAEMSLQMQEIGANITTAALPALKEFNALLVENKDNIQALGVGVSNAITGAIGIYKDNFRAINTALIGLAAVLVLKGVASFAKGVKQLNDDLSTAAKWVGEKGKAGANVTGRGVKAGWNWIRRKPPEPPAPPPEETPAQRAARIRERMGGRGVRRQLAGNRNPTDDRLGGLRSVASMTVNATKVYINGSVSGGGDGGAGDGGDRDRDRNCRRNRGGGRRGAGGGGGRRRIRINGPRPTPPSPNPPSPNPSPRGSRDNPYRVRRPVPPNPPPPPSPPSGGGRLRGFLKGASKAAKVGGIVGTAASVAAGAYDLYQASKKKGVREAVSTQGGAMVGGVAGGAIGGAFGSVLGPLGTMAGAYIGNIVGEKIGKFADESGLTRKVVDGAVGIFNSAKDTWSGVKGWFTGDKKEEKPGPPPEAKITINGLTEQKQKRLQQIGDDVRKSIVDKGLKEGLKTVAEQPEVKQRLNALKSAWGVVWKMGDSTKAQKDVKAVGTATKSSADEVAKGAAKNKQSFDSVSTAAKAAVDKTKQYLLSLKNVSSQGNSWGSDLMSRFIAGMRSQFPTLSSVISSVAVVLQKMKDAKDANSGGGGGGGTTPKSKPIAYAQGGYINRPHLGLVGEAGPEVIIPLSGNRRNRGMALWEQAGKMLGVRPYAEGGMVGAWRSTRPYVSKAKSFVDDNNDSIGYGAGYAEGIHSSLEQTKRQRYRRYQRSMSQATNFHDAYRRRAEGHKLRRQNIKIRGLSKFTKVLGKVARPIGYAMDLWDIVNAKKGTRGRQVAKVAGGILGGMAGGAAAGALLGTFLLPGIGTAVGGAIGGLLGAIGGEKIGTGLFDFFSRKRTTKKYASGGLISRPHMGLVGEAGPEMIIPLSASRRSRGRELWERAGIIMGVRPYANGGQVGRPSLIGTASMMPMAQMFGPSVSAAPKSVSIENINIDFGELAKGITDFVEFAKMFSSPQGRALIRKVVGEEMLKVLENGG